MQYQSTVFGQLLKGLPRGRFEHLAERHKQGRRKRELSSWGHMVTMVFAQTGGARSLRDLERMLERHHGVAAHLGLGRVKRSTLADANRLRSCDLFCDVAAMLASKLTRGQSGAQALNLIDATTFIAGKKVEHWAAGGGVKLHVVYEANQAHPVCFAVTPQRINDITAAQQMPIEPGATYVFDKGYYHFAFWAKLDAQGCRFVTRLRTNSPVTIKEERPVAEDASVLSDRVVHLSQRLSGSRCNPLDKPVRMIEVAISSGREITLVSNDLESSAEEIAALYKTRWQIELFFKWIKQNLKLGHFMGTSRNAVTIQIMAALIAFLLMKIAQQHAKATLGLQAVARLMQPLALVRRPIADLFFPSPPSPKKESAQLIWDFANA
jgi:hypothetical protein